MRVTGKSLQIRINNATVALATSCTLDLTLNALQARVKELPGANDVPDYVGAALTSESIVGVNDGVAQQTHATLTSALLQGTLVDWEFAPVANSAGALPAGDWSPGLTNIRGMVALSGKALVTSISVNGALSGKATLSVQLAAQGVITVMPTPEVAAYVDGNNLVFTSGAEVVNNNLYTSGIVENNNLTI